MKIKDLIEKLSKLGPDLEVFVNGYEGGYELLENITPPLVMINKHEIPKSKQSENVYGTYEVAQVLADILDDEKSPIAGIVLERVSSIPESHMRKENGI